MKPKRKVSANLGRTQHAKAERLYEEIKKRVGPIRRCPFYHGDKYPQFDEKSHDVLNPEFPNPAVPIEQFDFQFDRKNRYWKLQAYCKVCYKAYRDARIGKARATWVKSNGVPMKDDDIREWYRKNITPPTMKCSVCKRDLDPRNFAISKSMEKGLHNECFDCQVARGSSVREQEWLSDGNWLSWTRAVLKMRKKKEVRCAGWSRSVAAGACLKFDIGKSMHADHIVPLRAGGIHDVKNFQPLCTTCNSKKIDQIDPESPVRKIKKLIGKHYKSTIRASDSANTIERKLKDALVRRITRLVESGQYLDAIRAKKKEVNGQWDVYRVYKKGIEWLNRTTGKSF